MSESHFSYVLPQLIPFKSVFITALMWLCLQTQSETFVRRINSPQRGCWCAHSPSFPRVRSMRSRQLTFEWTKAIAFRIGFATNRRVFRESGWKYDWISGKNLEVSSRRSGRRASASLVSLNIINLENGTSFSNGVFVFNSFSSEEVLLLIRRHFDCQWTEEGAELPVRGVHLLGK